MTLRLLFQFALIGLVSSLGCSDGRPQRVPVAGQVLIDGEPLGYGFIQVIPANDRPATGKIGPDGRFQLTTFEPNDGCVSGNHSVTVIANESLGATGQRWHAPKKYMDPSTSELQVNVEGATQSLTIELSWDGGEPFVESFEAE